MEMEGSEGRGFDFGLPLGRRPSLARRWGVRLGSAEREEDRDDTRERVGRRGVEEMMDCMSGLGGEGKREAGGEILGGESCSSSESAVAARMSRISIEEMESLAWWRLVWRVRVGLAAGISVSTSISLKAKFMSILAVSRMSSRSNGEF